MCPNGLFHSHTVCCTPHRRKEVGMTFEEILDQVLALLQREQRVSYRALKRRFDLDDEYLEDLKDEIIKAKRLATDEEGSVLAWTGDPQTVTAHADQRPQPPAAQAQPSSQVALLTPAPHAPPDAERRQLTVMFCDLVDSTSLSGQLDPEDLRDVVRAYQEACAKVIARFEGHIAQYLGDGLLVYFGYPQAHEDDAQRAIRTGLSLVEGMSPLNHHLAQRQGIRLAIRVGIHTGLVVVGAMGEGGRQEQLALGDTPNIAARLQGLAAPDTVVISAVTHQLVQGLFTCQALSTPPLKGVAHPLGVYHVRGTSEAQSRFEVAVTRGLTPLVGRDEEVALLHRRWEQAKAGQGQVVLLSGEPGIGKSRLVQVLQEHVGATPHTRIAWRGLPYHQQSALYPVIAELSHRLRWHPDISPAARLRTLETTLAAAGLALAEAVPLLAALLSLPLPAAYPPLTLTPQRQRQRTFETLLAWLHADARRQPVLLIVEDLHWLDPSTLELLSLLIDQSAARRLCLVLTARPEFRPPWPMEAHLSVLTLRRLAPAQSAGVTTHVAGGKALPPVVLQEVVRMTDGVPLFVEELTKTLLETGLLEEHADHYTLHSPLPALAIPATLHDALLARLDRLAAAKGVAQLGATLGRTFAYDLLHAVSPWDEMVLQHGLRQLEEAELVSQRGVPPQATYTFKHALIQETAYQSLLKRTRQQYHQHIAQVLAEQFSETAEMQPELVAHHYTEAGLSGQAVGYWQRAGERAIAHSAHCEAIAHLTQGIAALDSLPPTRERLQQELALQTTLGSALVALRGYGAWEVQGVYTRAYELCQQVAETPQLLPVLWGLWAFYHARAEFQTAREVGKQLASLARGTQDQSFLQLAHAGLGQTFLRLGELTTARTSLEQAMTLDDCQQYTPVSAHVHLFGGPPHIHSQSLRGRSRSLLAQVLWHLGYPDQALEQAHQTVALAAELALPFSLVVNLNYTAVVHLLRREPRAVQERARAALDLSTEHGFSAWAAYATTLQGWALAEEGRATEGINQTRQGLAAWAAAGQLAGQPFLLALLAEMLEKMGETQEGLSTVAAALEVVYKTGERHWEVELYRLKGKFLLAQSPAQRAEAEACFLQALDVARGQQAKALELRAAMALSQLWQQQGKRTEAHALLAPVYVWFTEGFDTADLQEAKALLDTLA
jgi:class 3 adenylate cyclase/predicted ATPase